MANVNTLYPSTYLKAADLNGKTAKVTIQSVEVERIGSDTKPILYFRGKEKGMVLNKTNAFTISTIYGPDTDGWAGAEIEIFPAYVDFQGKQVEALRVRIPPRSASRDQSGFDDDENPAPKEARAAAYAEASGRSSRPAASADMDDDIPFAPEWRG